MKPPAQLMPWKGLAICVSVSLSPIFLVMLLLGGTMVKASHDIEQARDEIRRAGSPSELRGWVLAQSRRYPQGRDMEEEAEAWPSRLPRFSKKGQVRFLPVEGSHGTAATPIVAIFIWHFFDQHLHMVVRVNPDGTPADDVDDIHLRPEERWVEGITFHRGHK